MKNDLLIMIPTYNEVENAPRIFKEITALGIPADILFIDDNSPDGTADAIEKFLPDHSNLSLIRRSGKLGIGSAHLTGILHAYEKGYRKLLTMDCDFTHDPKDIPRMLDAVNGYDLALGSRYMRKGSLSEWNPFRKMMTLFAHFLTETLLGLEEDASGAFRIYDLEKIPLPTFQIITARSYSFFFESLFILRKNEFRANQIPIHLSARTYGSSKMSINEAARSLRFLIALWLGNFSCPEQFKVGKVTLQPREGLVDPQGWDPYWNKKGSASGLLYQVVAAIYRRMVIRPNLEYWVKRAFPRGARLLHAGCGSGQVDRYLQRDWKVTGLDISLPALRQYAVNNPDAEAVEHGSILDLHFAPESYDGIYNLGVMEHFQEAEIREILKQFHRVLKPGGKLLLFWPHACSTSVAVLKMIHKILKITSRDFTELHPAEITYVRSRKKSEALFSGTGFRLVEYAFGPRDFWVQAVLILEKE
ncbi:MAG: glycosyltransferase [Verrucomicrobiota bacterium]